MYFLTKIVIRSLLSAIFVQGVPDPTLEKVGSENLVRERCHVIVRVFVLDVRIAGHVINTTVAENRDSNTPGPKSSAGGELNCLLASDVCPENSMTRVTRV
jgi:hypothetical protein